MSDISDAKSASTATFVTALVFNAAVFGIELVVFTLIRPHFNAIYEPRTYAPPPSKRAAPLAKSLFGWPWAVFKADHGEIKAANGLDAYFFVRFLRMMAIIFLPIWVLSWVVLITVTAVNTGVRGKDGLDHFSFGNIAASDQSRYAAHIILVYLFTVWILYYIKREMAHFISVRQKFLIEPSHAQSVQANTILVTGIPAKYLTQKALLKLFGELPGGVKQIWLNRNLKELPDIYDRRLAACSKLESGETALLRTAAKLRLKAEEEAEKKSKAKGDTADPQGGDNIVTQAGVPAQNTDVESRTADVSIVPRSERPAHRLGFLGLFGKKVDTIEWARAEIAECTRLLDEGRSMIEEMDRVDAECSEGSQNGPPSADTEQKASAEGPAQGSTDRIGAIKKRVGLVKGDPGSYPPLNSAFVMFNKQIAAHLAGQVLTHHEPYHMSNKYLEMAPQDVIWGNLSMNPYEQKVRMAISYAATAGLIIFWAIPVAFVGVISNIHAVCQRAKFLAWICKLPPVVVGIISGVLPPVLLAVLMMLLPIVLRLLARFEGIPKRTGLELSLMTRYFIFQVVHSFLVVTLSSGIVASLGELLNNPTSIPTILAQNLPQASIFFLTYIILQGLSGVAGGFLQIVPLIIYYVKLFLLGSTPRSVHGVKYGLGSVAWGTAFPGMTLLVVITLGYSIISPVINGLACATFFAFYQLFKYLFLWVYEQPSTSDTGGLFFPKAMQHIFVGLYVQQICLAALFFLARNQDNHPSATAEGVLMAILIVLTAGYNLILNHSYGPLLSALPLTLTDKTYTAPVSPTGPSDEAELAKQGIAVSQNDKEADEQDEEDEIGFAHPAASYPQRIVWIPQDALGIAQEETRACEEQGVRISVRNAMMNGKGKVDVVGRPPGSI